MPAHPRRLRIPLTMVPLLALGCPKASPREPAVASKPVPRSSPAPAEGQALQAREQNDRIRWTNPACVELEAALRNRYRPGGTERLEVSYEGEPLELPSAWTLDVQTGSGHGGGLRFLRFESDGERIAIEEIVWKGRSLLRGEVDGGVRRAQVEAKRLESVLELLRYLPCLRLAKSSAIRVDRTGRFWSGGWHSSDDFLARVLVLGPAGEPLLERSFAGYPSSAAQFEYLPTQVVCAAAQKTLSGIDGWTEVPKDELRSCHFVSAFASSLDDMLEESYWWVMERSVEALGYFGHPGATPTLEVLKSRPRLVPRQAAKIEAVLSEPDRWLTGAPKQLPE